MQTAFPRHPSDQAPARPPDADTALKRLVEVLVSAAALVLASPLMCVVALAIRLTMGRPVLFRQERVGLLGRPFSMVKFRTMRHAVGEDGRELPDRERLTRLGAFLRSTSLDELPGFVNVVLGHMNIVGPRPLLPEYLPLYSPRQSRRHEVRPGITGWAQVNGRNALTWHERLELDVWYVENRSFLLDLTIIWRTVGHVMRRTGVSAPGEATMTRFTGKNGDQ